MSKEAYFEQLWQEEMKKLWDNGGSTNFSKMHDICKGITDTLLDKLLEEVERMYEFKGTEAYCGIHPIFTKRGVTNIIRSYKK